MTAVRARIAAESRASIDHNITPVWVLWTYLDAYQTIGIDYAMR